MDLSRLINAAKKLRSAPKAPLLGAGIVGAGAVSALVPEGTEELPPEELEPAPAPMVGERSLASEPEAPLITPNIMAALTKGMASQHNEDTQALDEAQKTSDQLVLGNQLAAAGNLMGSGIGAMATKLKPTTDESKDIIKRNIDQAQKRPAQEKERIAAGRKASLYDPKSEVSKAVLAIAKQAGISLPDGVSAGHLKDAGIDVDRLLSVQESAKNRRATLDIALKDKHDRHVEQDLQKLSKDIAGVQDLTKSLDEVEQELGFTLEQADAKGDSVKVGGKTLDLPGVSIPGIGRVSAHSDKAQRLQSAASKVFNSVLKDRSGAAVTNSELARLRTEFGEGRFNTEAQLVNALQRYKRAVEEELRNREAAYSPEVVQKYTTQGGRTSKSSNTRQTAGEPATKVINGVTYRKVDGGWESVD